MKTLPFAGVPQPRSSLSVLLIIAFLAFPAFAMANASDVSGGAAIGTGYAGINSAPTNGLIVQGEVGIGTSSPSYMLDVRGTEGVSGLTNLTGGLQLNTVEVPMAPGGRLTLQNGTSVMSGDVSAATTIYYTDYLSDVVPIYNGSHWLPYSIGTTTSLALDSNSADTGYQASGSIYDLFFTVNSGTLYLVTGPAWTNTTTRSAALALQNGIWTNSAGMTVRFGNSGANTFTCSANQCTYVGSVYVPAAATTLSAAISSTSSTSLSATSACGTGTYCFPYAGSFYIKIDSEIMLVTAGQSTTTWTISRGQLGTAAATHSNGATINMAGGQTAMQFSPANAVGGNAPLLGLYNAYNRLPLTVFESDSTNSSHTDNASTWQAYNSSKSDRIIALDGLGQSPIKVFVQDSAAVTTGGTAIIATAKNAISYVNGLAIATSNLLTSSISAPAFYSPVTGLFYISALEFGTHATFNDIDSYGLFLTIND